MIPLARGRAEDRLDPATTATFFGATSGVLSVLFPFFDGLTVALAALLLLAGVRRHRTGSTGATDGRALHLLCAGCLAAGWGLFLFAPGSLAPVRGLALGLAGLPYGWRLHRRSSEAAHP